MAIELLQGDCLEMNYLEFGLCIWCLYWGILGLVYLPNPWKEVDDEVLCPVRGHLLVAPRLTPHHHSNPGGTEAPGSHKETDED